MNVDGPGATGAGYLEAPSIVGQVLDGRYKITRKIGEGGMGEVYAAEHVHIEKKYAIKLLRPEIVSNAEAVQRFRQEARSSSSIGHRNIIAIEDFGALPDGRIYMCMELLNGAALNDLITTPQPVDRLLNILIQTGHGLAAAHAKGITHRDMKPENIFVTIGPNNEDIPKLLDFGIAKVAGNDGQNHLTRTGTIFGTPFYMAPEQALGNPVDARTDIYAMGVIMYEVFAGSLPFQGESFMGILTQHITTEPEPVAQRAAKTGRQLPMGLADIITRCMQKNPASRFSSMDELVNALVQVYRGIAGAGMSTYMEAFHGSAQHPSAPTPGAMTGPMKMPTGQSGPVHVGGAGHASPSQPNPMGQMGGMGPGPTGPTVMAPGMGQGMGQMAGSGGYAMQQPGTGPYSQVGPAPKKSSMTLVIVIIAILVLGGGGAAAFFLLNKDDTTKVAGGGSEGSDKDGSNKEGSNKEGSNKEGSNKEGSNKEGSNKITEHGSDGSNKIGGDGSNKIGSDGSGTTPGSNDDGDIATAVEKLAAAACECKDHACGKKVLGDFAELFKARGKEKGDRERLRKASGQAGKCLDSVGISKAEVDAAGRGETIADAGSNTPQPPDAGVDTPHTVNVMIRAKNAASFDVFENGKKILDGAGMVEITPGIPRTILIKSKGFKDKTLVVDGSQTKLDFKLDRLPTVTPGSGSDHHVTPPPPLDCRAVLIDGNNAGCRKQYCGLHPKDVRCDLE